MLPRRCPLRTTLKFPFSYAATYRFTALKLLIQEVEKHRSSYFRSKRGNSQVVYRSLDSRLEQLESALHRLEAQSWCDLFHMSGKSSVKLIAQYFANFYSGNFNIALAILQSTPWERAPEAIKLKLGFPVDETSLKELVSSTRLKSLDSDVEREIEATSVPIVRVKHRDYVPTVNRPVPSASPQELIWYKPHRCWYTAAQIRHYEEQKSVLAGRRLEQRQLASHSGGGGERERDGFGVWRACKKRPVVGRDGDDDGEGPVAAPAPDDRPRTPDPPEGEHNHQY